MIPGNYKFFVKLYSDNGGSSQFRGEVTIENEITYSYSWNQKLKEKEKVVIGIVNLSEDGIFTLVQGIQEENHEKN